MLYLQIASPKSSVLNFLDSNSFEVIISIFQRTEKVPDMERLRKKIEPEPDRPRYIVTVRGVGYKYTENEEMVGKTATPPE